MKKDYKGSYKEITAPNSLKRKVNATMKKETGKNKVLKYTALSVAASFIAFVFVMNIFPMAAYAATNIPVIGALVRVVTLDKYNFAENGFEAEVVTPKIEGLLDPVQEEELNRAFKENAAALIAGFEQDVKQLKEEGLDDAHMGIESNYTLKTDTADFLSLDVYTLNTVGSSSTVHSFFTVDKASGQLLKLTDLFEEGSDFVTPLSSYIKEEMGRLNKEEAGMFWIDGEEGAIDGFATITEDQDFYINVDNQLVICFDKYVVAAGAQGSPEFIIPIDVIKDVLSNQTIK